MNWISTKEACALLGYRSPAGCNRMLKARGIRGNMKQSARGTPMYTWDGEAVARLVTEKPRRDRGVAKHRKEEIEIHDLNACLNEPAAGIAAEVREIFERHRELIHLFASHTSKLISYTISEEHGEPL